MITPSQSMSAPRGGVGGGGGGGGGGWRYSSADSEAGI